MRNIKKYMTEDAFAQAENNSGYPSGSMTTARPGMAYIRENRNVYFNASPLPPPPEFKYYYYFSGVTNEYFNYNNGEWVSEHKGCGIFIFPSIEGPISEFYAITEVYENEGQLIMDGGLWHCPLPSGQTITLNSGDYWMFLMTEGKDESSVVTNVKKMYTLGETDSFEDGGSINYFQIFYESGDTENVKYYIYTGYENIESNKGEFYFWNSEIYVLSDSGITNISSWNDLEWVSDHLLKVQDNWPTQFTCLPTYCSLDKYFDTDTPLTESRAWCNGEGASYYSDLIEVEQIDDEHYKVLSFNLYDVSSFNMTITLGEYWGTLWQEGEFQLVKFVTDDVIQEYDMSDSNTTRKILYKTFYTEDDVNHANPLYVTVSRSNEYNNGNWRDGDEVIYQSHFPILFWGPECNNEAGFVFRLTEEDSDLFNPPTIEDIDPDWPNDSNNGGSEIEGGIA